MKIKIVTSYKFELELSKAECQAIHKASQTHYDYTCRALSRLGGMTYGWMNYFNLDETDSADKLQISLSFRDIDILSKVIEFEPKFESLRLQFAAAVHKYNSLSFQEKSED